MGTFKELDDAIKDQEYYQRRSLTASSLIGTQLYYYPFRETTF